jgi:phosphatidylglycerophosphatase A
VSLAATSRGDALARWIATAGGLGYAPFAPGTVTSLPVALLVWAAAPPRSWLVGATAAVSAVGIWAAGREEARTGEHDPSSIVVDEVAGMLVAMLAAPPGLGWTLLLFFLFRVMDVWKPFPIDRLQDLPGGWGIVVDDLLAGVYAGLVGWLVHLLWLRA